MQVQKYTLNSGLLWRGVISVGTICAVYAMIRAQADLRYWFAPSIASGGLVLASWLRERSARRRLAAAHRFSRGMDILRAIAANPALPILADEPGDAIARPFDPVRDETPSTAFDQAVVAWQRRLNRREPPFR
jgi:hypothetical protein